MEGLPVARVTWVSHEPDVTTDAVYAEVLGAQEEGAKDSDYDKKRDSSQTLFGSSGRYKYTMTTSSGQYWGRFDVPTAEAVFDDDDTDGAIPVATARPDDRKIRVAYIRKVYKILAAQVMFTFANCACMTLNSSIREFAIGPAGGVAILYASAFLYFVSLGFVLAYKVSV